MRRLLVFSGLVTLVTACVEATAPRQFTLGPGCTKVKETLLLDGVVGMKVTTHDRDCTKLNLDSLRADGWVITWDTTWVDR